ncbi:MAG: hypothetical protein ACKO9Q_17470, partial [Pirellula sp.]
WAGCIGASEISDSANKSFIAKFDRDRRVVGGVGFIAVGEGFESNWIRKLTTPILSKSLLHRVFAWYLIERIPLFFCSLIP